MVEHRNVLSYVESACQRFGLHPGLRYCLASTISVDLAYTTLYPALLNGGTAYILTEEEATDGRLFRASLVRNSVDFLKITPSHLAALLEEGGREKLPLR